MAHIHTVFFHSQQIQMVKQGMVMVLLDPGLNAKMMGET
jgi:hypothetical protein